MASRITFPAAALLLLLAIAGKTSATSYVVGDSSGWTIPSGGAATYTAFSSNKTFRVGDLLVFKFLTGAHSLAIVSKQNYDACSSNNPISLVTTGPATVNLTSIGEAYFICTFNGHCSLGQKLAVNVSAASSASPVPAASPPTPAPKPSPAAPAPPTTAPQPSPAAPQPSPAAPQPSPAAPAISPSSPAPAPGPGGAAALVPTPATAPSPGAPGGGSSGSAPGSGPGGPPGDVTPPPSAAPASPTAAAALVFIASFAIANFF